MLDAHYTDLELAQINKKNADSLHKKTLQQRLIKCSYGLSNSKNTLLTSRKVSSKRVKLILAQTVLVRCIL